MSEKGSDEGLDFVRDVFGSDMEDEGDASQRSRPAPVLDDFSDEDDEEEAPRRRAKDKQRSHSKSKRSSEDRRRRDESDGDDADDLDLRRDSKRRRLHRATSDDDDNFIDDTGVEKQESDEDDTVPTEGGLRIGKDIEDNSEEEPKKPKNAFEDAVEKNRALRRPRRKELDPRKVEAECIAFLERMVRARDDDVRAYENGQPALEKLKMLREVEMMTTKVSHREVLLENMLLPVIKAWLDPMHDGALPNVQIRTTLLQILSDIKIDADWVDKLKRSQGLGRSINFLSRHDDHLPNRRMAEKLFQKWARPVFNSNANFHDILDEFDRPDEGRRGPKDGIVSTRRAAQKTVKHFKTAREKIESFKNTARGDDQSDQVLAQVPRPTPFLFTALAEGGVNVDEKQMRERRTQQATTKKVNKTMANMRRLNKTRSARAAKPSVNGRF